MPLGKFTISISCTIGTRNSLLAVESREGNLLPLKLFQGYISTDAIETGV